MVLINPLPNDKFLDWFKLRVLADNKIKVIGKNEICFGKDRKYCGKRRKYWLPKHFIFKVVKSQDCVVNGFVSWLHSCRMIDIKCEVLLHD